MQGEKIVERILQDAYKKKDDIDRSSWDKAELVLNDAKLFCEEKQREVKMQIAESAKKSKAKFDTMSKIEGGKILLQAKQDVLDDLKNKAYDFLCALEKKKLLSLVENLLSQFAEENDKLIWKFTEISEEDLKSLKVAKNLKLTFNNDKKLASQGLILEGKVCDKNLLFATLIENAFNENEEEIKKILF